MTKQLINKDVKDAEQWQKELLDTQICISNISKISNIDGLKIEECNSKHIHEKSEWFS